MYGPAQRKRSILGFRRWNEPTCTHRAEEQRRNAGLCAPGRAAIPIAALQKVAFGSPIRSIPPSRILRSESPASNSANLMLDEPPFIVRTENDSRLVSGVL